MLRTHKRDYAHGIGQASRVPKDMFGFPGYASLGNRYYCKNE